MGAPTLIVGIGGAGTKIATRVMDRVGGRKTENLEFVVVDTDANELGEMKRKYPTLKTVQTSPNMTVGDYLEYHNSYARDTWFPRSNVLRSKAFTEGAGQVRAISRLAFEAAIKNGALTPVEDAFRELQGLSADSMNQAIRVIVTGSLAGGTGSGLVLPMGLYLRDYVVRNLSVSGSVVRGYFLLPEVWGNTVLKQNEQQKHNMRSNAYAAIRELDAFMRKGDGFDLSDYAAVDFDIPRTGSAERTQYGAIRPYDFCFLMDAQNINGKVLDDLEAYLDYAADAIYAQAISPMSRRSNSSEDNVIREICGSNGRSRYCAAGVSVLEYPFADVRDYVALHWAKRSISQQWLEIDDMYEQAVIDADARGEDAPSLATFYVDHVNQFAEQGGDKIFYTQLLKQTKKRIKKENDVVEEKNKVDLYLAELKKYADRQAFSNYEIKAAQRDAKDKPELKGDSGDVAARRKKYIRLVSTYIRNVENYHEAVQERLGSTAQAARSLFAVSDPSTIARRAISNEEHYLEYWLAADKGAVDKTGECAMIHPNAIRYFLYFTGMKLSDKIKEADSKAIEMKELITDMLGDGTEEKKGAFDVDKTDQVEDASAALSYYQKEASKGTVFGKFAGSLKTVIKKGEDATIEIIEQEITDKLVTLANNLDAFCEATVEKAVYEAALEYVQNLGLSFAEFYHYIGAQIPEIDAILTSIETNRLYNATSDESNQILEASVRYVCADIASLRAINEAAVCPSAGQKLPGDVASNIYSAMLDHATRLQRHGFSASPRNRANERQSYFSGIFESAIVDYWRGVLLSSQYREGLIDVDIVKALRNEALFRKGISDASEQSAYACEVISTAQNLSAPMLEKVQGNIGSQIITACMYSDNLKTDRHDEMRKSIIAQLREMGGVEYDQISKYTIMFYQSIYGLMACQIPKFSSRKRTSLEKGGIYHEAYLELIQTLNPARDYSATITPHIDNRWHLVANFPDIDEDEESRQRYEIVLAFVHGLVSGKINAFSVAGFNYVYQVSIEGETYDLLTSNGTSCDEFYEIFDALNQNPPLVQAILRSRDQELRRELDAGVAAGGLSGCRFVNYLGSTAFGKPSGFKSGKDQAREPGFRIPEIGDERRSIFEIPLLYKLTLPQTEYREVHTKQMLDAIFSIAQDYFANFSANEELEQDISLSKRRP